MANTPLYIGITETKLESGLGYAIGNPNDNGAKIWNLIQYQSETSATYSENNIYCLKSGAGFVNVDRRVTYDTYYDMKTERATLQTQNQNQILNELATGIITLDDGTQVSKYSAILAMMDLFYYSKSSTQEERQALLQDAQIPTYTYNLTDDDIEAVSTSSIMVFY